MPTREELDKQRIDKLFVAAGWVIQDPGNSNRSASLGIAISEFPLPSRAADYPLFVQGKAAGDIETKKAGTTIGDETICDARNVVLNPHWRNPHPLMSVRWDLETSTLFRCRLTLASSSQLACKCGGKLSLDQDRMQQILRLLQLNLFEKRDLMALLKGDPVHDEEPDANQMVLM